MVPPEAGERHTNGLAFAFIIAQPKKRGKHVRGIGEGKCGQKAEMPRSESLPLEGKVPNGVRRMRWHFMSATGYGG